MTKKRSNQKGRGTAEENSRYQTYLVYRENSIKAGIVPPPYEGIIPDIDETKYDGRSALEKYIKENHLISSVVGGVVGIGANVLFPGSGAVAGPALKIVLQQMGLGAPRLKHHRKDPVSTKFTRIQHGKGANLIQSVQRNPIMCSPNSNSYGGIKF